MEGIFGLKTADASVLSLIVLIIIFSNSQKRFERAFISNRLFSYMVVTNMIMIIIDLLSWAFNALPGEINFALNAATNAALYISASVAPSMWLIYVGYQIFQSFKRVKLEIFILSAAFLLNAIASAASIFTGWYFFIDASNVYHRGSLFFINAAYNYAIMAYAFFLVLLNKKKIEKNNFYPMLLFFVPIFIGTLAQLLFYGVSLNWVGMAVSLFVVYLYIQNRGLNTDYLTGAFNRRQFEMYINLKEKPGARPFSAIMLDFDGLKRINDTYGHAAGDDALITAVNIMKKCIRKNDFIARIGGDEFAVIIDTDSQEVLMQAQARIVNAIERHNVSSGKPYKISFSAGWGVLSIHGESPKDFINSLDMKMYQGKAGKGTGRPAA